MKVKIYRSSYIVFAIFLYVGCGNNSNTNPDKRSKEPVNPVTGERSQDSSIVRVYVNKDSKIKANGKLVSLTELDTLLHQLQAKGAAVYYSRYNAQAYEAPKASLNVLDLIIKYKLPLRFFTDSTFSEIAPMN